MSTFEFLQLQDDGCPNCPESAADVSNLSVLQWEEGPFRRYTVYFKIMTGVNFKPGTMGVIL